MNGLMKMGAFLMVAMVSTTGCLVDSEPQDEVEGVDATTESADVDIIDYEAPQVDREEESRFDASDARDRLWFTLQVDEHGQTYWEERPFDMDREGGEPNLTRGDLDSE